MPYRLSWNESGVCVQYNGVTSDEEVARAAEIIEGDERFDRLRYVLHDFLKCDGLAFSPSRIEEIASIDAAAATANRSTHRLSIAVVTERSDVTAMANAYIDTDVHPHTMRIFSRLDDARTWLSSVAKN